MKENLINYNMIKGIVDYVIEWCNDSGIALRLGRKQVEAIGALYGMTQSEVLDKIVETLERTPINENGDYLTGRWEETTDAYILHAKLYDEDEDED